MPQIVTTSFTRVNFSDEEYAKARQFTDLNRLFFVNRRAELAEQVLRLVFDPEKVAEYQGNKAHLDGQIKILDELIGD